VLFVDSADPDEAEPEAVRVGIDVPEGLAARFEATDRRHRSRDFLCSRAANRACGIRGAVKALGWAKVLSSERRSFSELLGQCLGLGCVPVEPHPPEALLRLLDQFRIRPHHAEGA
jgi:hypothetical protein